MNLHNKYSLSEDSPKKLKIQSKNLPQSNNLSQSKSNITFSPSLILKNTEFMTNIQNYLSIKRPYTQVQYDYLSDGIDPASLCRILVQGIYLLQTCYLYQIKLYLSLNLYTDKGKYIPTTPNLKIFQFYCFQDQLMEKNLGIKEKMFVLKHKFIKVFEDEKNRFNDFFIVLELMFKHIRGYLDSTQKIGKSACQKGVQLEQNRKCLQQFVEIYKGIILPQKSRILELKYLIKYLQQTKLFRQHSVLVNIMSNTLFYSIKLYSKEILEELKQSVSQIMKLFEYNIGEMKYDGRVVKIIDNFFAAMCLKNLIEITKSLKGREEEEQNLDKDGLSLFDYDDSPIHIHPTISALIQVPEHRYLTVNKKLLEHILCNFSLQDIETNKQVIPSKNIQIQIFYTQATNDIHVNCVTDIEVSIDSLDYLNYLIAVFNQQIDSILLVDIMEKFTKFDNKKLQKVIAFKLFFNPKLNQEPLTKILYLIDLALLAYKIFFTEFSKKTYIKLQDYPRRHNVCQMFSHYQNILKNIIPRFYSQLKTIK